jgi:hypothetical protein
MSFAMSSANEDTRLTLLLATREIAAEAMRRAAMSALGTAEHDFYSGVRTAAEAYRRAGRALAEIPGWFDSQTPAFREGYLEAQAAISAAASHPRLHLLIPTYRTTWTQNPAVPAGQD